MTFLWLIYPISSRVDSRNDISDGGAMPHLQFEVNQPLADADKIDFAAKVRQLFSEIMDTGTDHISISIREFGTYNLSIGRVTESEKGIALVNADIREGRTMEKRRQLTLGFMELLHQQWHIPKKICMSP